MSIGLRIRFDNEQRTTTDFFRGITECDTTYSGEQMMIEARLEDLEFAAKIVRKRLGTVDQAAKTCGVSVSALEAHLSAHPGRQTKHKQNSFGSLGGAATSGRDQKIGGTEQSTSDEHDRSIASAGEAQQTTDYFVFHLDDERWVWKRVDEKHNVVKSSEKKFNYYLDCITDAQSYGFIGKPVFIFAESDLVSKSQERAPLMKSEHATREDDSEKNNLNRPATVKLES